MLTWIKPIYSIFLILLLMLAGTEAYARRGCCSHHGGVAYCDNKVGRLICHDGSYSPSCGCAISQEKTETQKPDTQSESKELFK